MKKQIKVTVEYLGHFKSEVSEDYRITRVIGAPFVEINTRGCLVPARVGDIIDEKTADDLASRVELTTISRAV